jgi:predicted amidohydrolase
MKLVLVQPELSYDTVADNPALVARLLEPLAPQLGPADIVLLPEHFDLRASRSEYETGVTALARRLGCHVVGGSHHEQRGEQRVNAGVVSDGAGQIVGAYEKLRPYATERSLVEQGQQVGELTIGELRLLILICADFWFSDIFHRASQLPDLVLVPAHSVSRKPSPDYSRELWRHLAVARAYEFGVYVGISDWAYNPSTTRGLPASGVAGFANPTTTDPTQFFTPVSNAVSVIDLNLQSLKAFRQDRSTRGFFWKPIQ